MAPPAPSAPQIHLIRRPRPTATPIVKTAWKTGGPAATLLIHPSAPAPACGLRAGRPQPLRARLENQRPTPGRKRRHASPSTSAAEPPPPLRHLRQRHLHGTHQMQRKPGIQTPKNPDQDCLSSMTPRAATAEGHPPPTALGRAWRSQPLHPPRPATPASTSKASSGGRFHPAKLRMIEADATPAHLGA